MKPFAIGVLLLLLAVLPGCAQGPLEVGYEGNDAGWDAVQKAAADWNEACGEELVHAVRGHAQVPIAVEPGPTFSDGGVTPQGVYGLTHHEKDVLGSSHPTWIKFVGDNSFPEYTVAHELGHALGIMDHEPDGIMGIHHVDPEASTGRLPPGLIGKRQCAEVRGR